MLVVRWDADWPKLRSKLRTKAQVTHHGQHEKHEKHHLCHVKDDRSQMSVLAMRSFCGDSVLWAALESLMQFARVVGSRPESRAPKALIDSTIGSSNNPRMAILGSSRGDILLEAVCRR